MGLLELTNLSHALSDPTRVRILASLLGGWDEELCVCEVTELFDLAPSTVSKHLTILRQAGLVEGRKQGRWMFYRPVREPGVGGGGGAAAAEALRWVRAAAVEDHQLRTDATRLGALKLGRPGCCDSASDGEFAGSYKELTMADGCCSKGESACGCVGGILGDEFAAESLKRLPVAGQSDADGSDEVRRKVREGYAKIAREGVWTSAGADEYASCCGVGGGVGGGCCGGVDAAAVALAVGYDEAELAALPEGANMGLSCGNPTALASLAPGEVVLDLGSGGGFDCFLAGRKVGAAGRVIGVDMTAEMVSKARNNIAGYRRAGGPDNVEFRLGEIEHLPVADASVDVVVSNCVINLSPDKERVWDEIARVLKPGGRVAVSDIALLRPLPADVLRMVGSLIGCIAGAALVRDTERMVRAAGLRNAEFTRRSDYIDAMIDSKDPLYQNVARALPPGTKVGDYITSLEVRAVKPAATCCGSDCCGG